MRRREFIAITVGATTWPLAARAQRVKRARIGWLSIASHPFIKAFHEGMRDLGWIEDDNLEIDQRYAEGHAERLIDIAAGLAQSQSDVIVASGSDAVEAAAKTIHSRKCCSARHVSFSGIYAGGWTD